MATFPKTIPDVRAALLAWTPHPTVADEVNAAQPIASPVVQFVQVFNTLKNKIGVLEAPAEGEDATLVLDTDGLKLLAGCAYLIHANVWHGLADEAYEKLAAAVAALDV